MILVRGIKQCIIFGIALSGLVAQVIQVSLQYFSYSTTTRTQLTIPEYLRHHAVSLCIRYRDLLDTDKIFQETGIRIDTKWNGNFTEIERFQATIDDEGKLTIGQIFDYTPKADGVIASCIYRPYYYDITGGDYSECNDYFNVSRYFTQEYICYKFEQRDIKEYNRLTVTTSTFYNRGLYFINLMKAFDNISYVKPISYTGGYPWLSSEFSPTINLVSVGSNYNLITITPSDAVIILLPAPFDTKCLDLPDDKSARFCKKDCWRESLAPLKITLPWSITLEDDPDLKPATLLNLKNNTFRAVVDKVLGRCGKHCDYKTCTSVHTRTTPVAYKTKSDNIQFSLQTPIDAEITITAIATMSFIDFFTFTCSSFGTWFGISFISLASFSVMGKRKKKRNNGLSQEEYAEDRGRQLFRESIARAGLSMR